ncbi:MAG TPA: hypothetical protein VFV01_47675 [Spirillospora sp.]|nr:hypothetical protein [Spirillospora sp.]
MPLPAGGSVAWPPPDTAAILDDARAWAAWWSGDLAELIATSGTDLAGLPFQQPAPAERRFNMGQVLRRRFWQRRADARDATQAVRPAHAPLASDMAATSADLLFGTPPDLTLPESTTKDGRPKVDKRRDAIQARMETLIGDTQVNLWSRLLEAAEGAAATGGCYLRAVWDETVADHPLSVPVDQKQALPEFRFGRLVAVTFWEDVFRDGDTVWRHLERHEPGRVLHGLYEGRMNLLGTPRGLKAQPATAALPEEIVLPAGLPHQLLVEYVPNVLPNRRHRTPVGRSDFAGSEGHLDGLDEVWTSLFRDFRLGQARIITPLEFLTAAGSRASDGRYLDVDTELLTGLNIAELEKLTNPIQLFQPSLRVTEHLAAVVELVKTIVSAAGYSPQTYGIDINGSAESGTALRMRHNKTINTTQRKRGYFSAAIVRHVETLLAIDQVKFGGPGWDTPTLEWEPLDDDVVERATTTQTWRAAQAMSIKTAVKEAHPRWSEDEVDEEVALIEGEAQAANPLIGLDGDGNPVDLTGQQPGPTPTEKPKPPAGG